MPKRVLATVCLAAAVAPVVGCSLNKSQPESRNRQHWPDQREVEIPEYAGHAPESESPFTTPPIIERTADVTIFNSEPSADTLRRRAEAHAAALELLLREKQAESVRGKARGSAVEWLEPRHEPESAAKQPPDHAQTAARVHRPPASPPSTQPTATSEDSNTPLSLADVNDDGGLALVTPNNSELPPLEPPNLEPEKRAPASPADAGKLLTRIAGRVKDNPRDIANHLEYQLLLFLMDEQVPDLATIATLPQEDRELVTAVLDGVSNLRATLRRDANALIGEKIRPVIELSDRLRTSAELAVPVMTLCSRVDGFGRYDPMDARFIAGKDSPTIIYCEIENFSSQYSQAGWETTLSMELSLFSEAGQQVYVEQPVQISDQSKSRRHDFFLRKVVKVPSNLTIGRYVLKVTIVDTQSNRVAETSLPLQVVAQ